MKCHKCEKPISENYYCDECAIEKLDLLKQPNLKPKPKNPAKLIHKAMFG
jgi:hypothetical protein